MKDLRHWIIGVFLLIPLLAVAQQIKVSGAVYDKKQNEAIIQATVQLLHLPDSTMTAGAATDEKGHFTFTARPGKYAIKVSYVGYLPTVKPLTLTTGKNQVEVGSLFLEEDAITLGSVMVTAQAAQVVAKGDTLEYSSSAYRVPEGSTLEALVKKLPGAEIDENGKITVNGKEVKKITIDGKEFFANDPNIALKNIPVNMVDKVKTYDKKSDLARVTGIDDGDDETVLDLSVKPGMKKGWFGNLNLGAGTDSRYNGKLLLNRFSGDQQLSFVAGTNNVNDNDFGSGGFRSWGRPSGMNTVKTIGLNLAIAKDKVEIGGSTKITHTKGEVWTKTASETFITSATSSYGRSISDAINKSFSIQGDYKVEWKPDTLTNLIFRPNFSYNSTNNKSNSRSYTFNEDPEMDIDALIIAHDANNVNTSTWVNSLINAGKNIGKNTAIEGDLQINRNLGKNGRNITLRLRAGYTDNDSEQLSTSLRNFYQVTNSLPTNAEVLNRYIFVPTKNYNYSARLMYSEPIARSLFLQLSYQYQYRNSKLNNAIYDMPSSWTVENGWNDSYLSGYNERLSKNADYDYYNNQVDAQLRWITSKARLNVGISLQPQHTRLSYKHISVDTIVKRNVFNFTPTLDFNYSFSKTTRLFVNYRGRSSQPSMTDLLDIKDDTNPLNVRIGNSGLKPVFTNTLRAFFNSFNATKQRGIMASLFFVNELNSITTRRSYDASTGGYTSKPENINGNWNLFSMFNINSALKDKRFTLTSSTFSRFNNINSYMSTTNVEQGEKNSTRQLSLSERLNLTFRNDWLEIGASGSINYTHSTNTLQPQYNMDTYQFSYGFNTNIQLPWSMSISTDITQSSRRGYSDNSMNRNELVWNAQISKNFLKGNAATLSLQVFDILRRQSNISRNISAAMRQDVETNGIFHYGMLHFIYRLNIFGANAASNKFGGNFLPPPGGGFGGGRR